MPYTPALVGRLPRRYPWLLGGALVLVLVVRWLTTDPAMAVAMRAARALERRDAVALVALADPLEVRELHLTPRNVHAILDRTLWRTPRQEAIYVRADAPTPTSSYRPFTLTPDRATNPADPWQATAQAWVVRSRPGDRWTLRLSLLLYHASVARPLPGADASGRSSFRKLASAAGVIGFWDSDYEKYLFTTDAWSRLDGKPYGKTHPFD